MPTARNPRAEAQAVVGDAYDARVLEPSPPADTSQAKADDPPAPGDRAPDTTLLTPADGSWEAWIAGHPEAASWAAERWLGAYRRLAPAPEGLVGARERLHLLLTNVVTPARYAATGKIAARWTLGGFGTPFFLDDAGRDTQVRVEADRLVVQRGTDVDAIPLATVGDAAEAVAGSPTPDMQWVRDLDLHDVPPTADPSDDVSVDADAARFLGDWFGFAYAVLERLRGDDASTDASRPQLWPEHFDPAIEVLAPPRRASYGFSPGDAGSDQPYVYVSIWAADELDVTPRGGVWNAEGFPGAILTLDELAAADDQVAATLGWLRVRRDALAASAMRG